MAAQLLLILSVVFEIAAVFAWFRLGAFVIAFTFHLLTVAMLSLAVYLLSRMRKKSDELRAVYFYAAMLTLFFPCVGLVSSLFIIFIVAKRISGDIKATLYGEYEKYIAGKREEVIRSRAVFSELLREIRREVSFEPFIDTIRGTNIKIKERVLEKLAKIISVDSVSLIKEALKDPSPEIRFYAAAALLKMEGSLNEKVRLVSVWAKQRGSFSDFAALGDLYRTYVDVGLVERYLNEHYLSLSCKAYQSALDIDSNQPAVVVNYTRSLMALKHYQKAKSLLDRAVKIWPTNLEIIFLRNGLYFKLGNFDEVDASLSQVDPANLDDQKKAVLRLWKIAK